MLELLIQMLLGPEVIPNFFHNILNLISPSIQYIVLQVKEISFFFGQTSKNRFLKLTSIIIQTHVRVKVCFTETEVNEEKNFFIF